MEVCKKCGSVQHLNKLLFASKVQPQAVSRSLPNKLNFSAIDKLHSCVFVCAYTIHMHSQLQIWRLSEPVK